MHSCLTVLGTDMNRLSRDVLIAIGGAVAGGAILGIIAAFTTHLTRLQLVGVGAGTLVICILLFGGSWLLFEVNRRRRAAFEARIIKIVTEAVLTKMDSRIAGQIQAASNSSSTNTNVSTSSTNIPATLRNLLEDGRVLQARLGERDSSFVVASDLSVEIARWEARSLNALMDQTDRSFADDFRNQGPGDDVFTISGFRAYNRMGHQLATIEQAIRHGLT